MSSLYPGTSVSGYNSNPPPDDGTTGANNQVTWTGIKSKLGDPLNTFAAAVDTAITNAMNKTVSGGSVVSTAVDYPCSAADQGRNIVVTVSGKTVTTPDATSVHSPFVFCVNNQSTGNVTVAGFGGTQNVDGSTTARLGAGRGIILWTDGVNWFSSGLVMGNLPTANPPFGFDVPLNLRLNATVGSGILTIAVKANDNTDPTTSNPVLIPFRSSTLTIGTPAWVAITSALSITTNAIGATLGTQNNVPFRLWVLMFRNGSTPFIALWHSGAGASSPAINPLNEATLQNTTGISAAATSSGVFYTPNGTSLSSSTFRIIGYIDYVSGLAAAGNYTAVPDVVQLFGPGIKKPGEVLQTVYATTTTTTNINSTSKIATALTAPVTVTSNVNPTRLSAAGHSTINSGSAANSNGVFWQLWRNTGTVAVGSHAAGQAPVSNTSSVPVYCGGLDFPAASNWPPTQYGLYGLTSAGSNTNTFMGWTSNTATLSVDEIMG